MDSELKELLDGLADSQVAALKRMFDRVLAGESVKVGILNFREDFPYTRRKDPATGQPVFERVIAVTYYDEDGVPSTDDFDGTLYSFASILDAHGVLTDISATEG